MNDQTLPKPTAPNNTNNSSTNTTNLPQVVASVPKPAVPDPVAKPAYKPTNFSASSNIPKQASPMSQTSASPMPAMNAVPPMPKPPAPSLPKLPNLPNLPNLPKAPSAPVVQSTAQPKMPTVAQDVPMMPNKPSGLPSLPNLPKPPQVGNPAVMPMPKPPVAPATSTTLTQTTAPVVAPSSVPPMPKMQQATLVTPSVATSVPNTTAPAMNTISPMPKMSNPAPTAVPPMANMNAVNGVPPMPKPPITSSPAPVASPNSPNSPSSTSTTSTSTQVAAPKRSLMSYLPFIFGGFLIVGILAFFGLRFFSASNSVSVAENTSQTGTNNSGNTNSNTSGSNANAGRTEVPTTQTAITYWGLFESNDLMQAVIKDFEAKNPSIKVNYVQQSYRDYRERLSTAITGGTGPDLFRFHASWVPMLKTSLSPIPSSVITAKDMKDNFYPAVTEQLSSGGQYVGVPMMYDGLALYYNEDILKAANETVPSTWMDLQKLAQKLTIRSANGVERGGLAIGNTANVEHYPEILALLMMQNGADLTKPNSPQVRDALLYYTSFMTKDPVWSEKLPSSTVAFSRGEVAMMFAPSWRAHEIKALNPELKFGVAKLPQLSEEKVAYASYWAEGLNPNSKNKDAAAKFLAHLVNDETLKTFYSEASKVRGFGEIYPKVSMASLLSENKVAVPILEDAVYAKAWYLNSFTHDNGLNDQLIGYYKVAIDSFGKSTDSESALSTLEKGVTQVLKQYGIVK